jgi:hypothetical protein
VAGTMEERLAQHDYVVIIWPLAGILWHRIIRFDLSAVLSGLLG